MIYNELFRRFSIINIVNDIDKGALDVIEPFAASEQNYNLLNKDYHPFCATLHQEESFEVRNKSFPGKLLPLNGILLA